MLALDLGPDEGEPRLESLEVHRLARVVRFVAVRPHDESILLRSEPDGKACGSTLVDIEIVRR